MGRRRKQAQAGHRERLSELAVKIKHSTMEQSPIVSQQAQCGVAGTTQQPSKGSGFVAMIHNQSLLALTNKTKKLLFGTHRFIGLTVDAVIAFVVLVGVVLLHVGQVAFSILKAPFCVLRFEVLTMRQSIFSIVCLQLLAIGFSIFLGVGQFFVMISGVAFLPCFSSHILSDAIVRSAGKNEPAELRRNSQPPAYDGLVTKATESWEQKIGTKPDDNIFDSYALFHFLGEHRFKEEADGGRPIEHSLQYAVNSTFKSYSELETLDTSRVTVFDAARYEWKINAGTVVYSELERLRAQAASGKFDLIAEKLENGRMSHTDALNSQAWSDGTGNSGKDVGGLQLLISTTPTSGTVGQIDGSTFSWWRNQQTSGAKTSTAFDNLRASMRSIYNLCSRGGTSETPMAWMTTRTVFEGYHGLLVANERFTSKESGDGAFKNTVLAFAGAKGSYDEDAPSGNLYFFNNKALKFCYLKGGWMKMYPKVDPSNQLSNVHKVATFGNLSTGNRRRLGVVSAIT